MYKYDPKFPLAKSLSDDEEVEFIKYAIINDPPSYSDWGLYHPVCRKIWLARNLSPQEKKGE